MFGFIAGLKSCVFSSHYSINKINFEYWLLTLRSAKCLRSFRQRRHDASFNVLATCQLYTLVAFAHEYVATLITITMTFYYSLTVGQQYAYRGFEPRFASRLYRLEQYRRTLH